MDRGCYLYIRDGSNTEIRHLCSNVPSTRNDPSEKVREAVDTQVEDIRNEMQYVCIGGELGSVWIMQGKHLMNYRNVKFVRIARPFGSRLRGLCLVDGSILKIVAGFVNGMIKFWSFDPDDLPFHTGPCATPNACVNEVIPRYEHSISLFTPPQIPSGPLIESRELLGSVVVSKMEAVAAFDNRNNVYWVGFGSNFTRCISISETSGILNMFVLGEEENYLLLVDKSDKLSVISTLELLNNVEQPKVVRFGGPTVPRTVGFVRFLQQKYLQLIYGPYQCRTYSIEELLAKLDDAVEDDLPDMAIRGRSSVGWQFGTAHPRRTREGPISTEFCTFEIINIQDVKRVVIPPPSAESIQHLLIMSTVWTYVEQNGLDDEKTCRLRSRPALPIWVPDLTRTILTIRK